MLGDWRNLIKDIFKKLIKERSSYNDREKTNALKLAIGLNSLLIQQTAKG